MIDAVVMSCNEDPIYWEFWNPVSEHWLKEFGIRSLLFYYGEKNPSLSTENGDVIYQKPIDGVPDYVAATWGRFWVTKHLRNKMCLISDIDMFPLSRDFFLNKSTPQQDAYTHLNADAYYPGDFDRWKGRGFGVPGCYHLASSELMRSIYQPSCSFADEAHKILTADYSEYTNGFANTPEPHLQRASAHNGGMWGIDEMYSSMKLREYISDGGKMITKQNIPSTRRLCRARLGSQLHSVAHEQFIDFHSVRPYSYHKNMIHSILNRGVG